MTAEKIRPISPEEVSREKLKNFPNEVMQSFNEEITQNFRGGSATIRQDSVVNLMVSKGLKRAEIYKNGWLDVEDIYRKAGWKVDYDKPAYNESYEPTFTFSHRRRDISEW